VDRVRVSAGETCSAGPGHGAIKSLLGRVNPLFDRAVRPRRTVTSDRRLPPRDQVGLQRIFHLTLAGAERGQAVLESLLLLARLLLDGIELLPASRNQLAGTARPRRDRRVLGPGRTWLS